MNNPLDKNDEMNLSSIKIAAHQTRIIHKLQNILHETFNMEEQFYNKMEVSEYREILLEAQTHLNNFGAINLIMDSIRDDVFSYMQSDKLLVQSNIYLRGSRPINNDETENINWHRESFYGENLGHSVNIWTPLKNVSEDNTLRYVPLSHLLDDEEIITKQEESNTTKRYSTGQKLGFLYAPKIIIGGVDLEKGCPMIVPLNASAIFNGNLIHGAGTNHSNKIRFSLDFRIIKSENYLIHKQKIHFSSGKSYFIEY